MYILDIFFLLVRKKLWKQNSPKTQNCMNLPAMLCLEGNIRGVLCFSMTCTTQVVSNPQIESESSTCTLAV